MQGLIVRCQLILVRPLDQLLGPSYTLAVNSDAMVAFTLVKTRCKQSDIAWTACAMNTTSTETPAKMFVVMYSITMKQH